MRMLLLLVALLPFPSRAAEVEVAVGRSEYCCLSDGVWWQSPRGFQGDLRPTAYSVGLRQELGKGFHVHTSYVDLGKATGSNWASVPDDQFNNITTAHSGKFMAAQQVRGIQLGVSYRWKLTESVSIDPEIGHFFYKSQWRIDIHCPTLCDGNVPQEYQSFRYTSKVRTSSYLSGSITYNSVFVNVTRYTLVDGGGDADPNYTVGQFAIGLTSGPVTTWMVGARATF